MKKTNNNKGQALIETALVLLILLIILLGTMEFSRAYLRKSSLKNGVRQGARVAAVTSGLAAGLINKDCNTPPANFTNCPNADIIINAVCTTAGVGNTNLTSVCVTVKDENSNSAVDSGDTVTVRAQYNDPTFFILGGGIWPWGKSLTFVTDASFRYE